MRLAKMLGLFALVVTALMAVAGAVSATSLTKPLNTRLVKGEKIHAVHDKQHVTLTNPISKIECNSTVEPEVAVPGGKVGEDMIFTVTDLTFTSCTDNWHVTTVSQGDWTVKWIAPSEASVTSSGMKIDATRFGTTCVYETNNTPFGTFTSSFKTGATATIHIGASLPINKSESSGLCGSGNSNWTGGYSIDSPMELLLDQE